MKEELANIEDRIVKNIAIDNKKEFSVLNRRRSNSLRYLDEFKSAILSDNRGRLIKFSMRVIDQHTGKSVLQHVYDDRIVNPLTDQLISRGTALHRRLIIQGHLPVPDGMAINPHTKRLIKKGGKVWKKLMQV